jgi:hypothetical protein
MIGKGATVALFGSLLIGAVGSLAAAPKDSGTAAVAGIAKGADQRPLNNYLVRLRSLDTATVVATTRTSATGAYAFRDVNAGRYGVEILDATNKMIGTAGPFVVSSTAGRSRLITTNVAVAGAAAAGLAALSTSSTATAASKGSAVDVAAAAAGAGITGTEPPRPTTRVLPSCC